MPLQPPSRYEIAGFPMFTITWFGDPGDGTSIVAYSGGGGSARTGIKNCIGIILNDDPEPVVINLGAKLGTAVHIYGNPKTRKVWLLVAVSLGKISDGSEIHRYSLPDCQLNGILRSPTACNALAVNAATDMLALGCEDGSVQLHDLADEAFGLGTELVIPPIFVFREHKDAVCALSFSCHGDRLLSSAKDGTACVVAPEDFTVICQVTCPVDHTPVASNKKPARKYGKARVQTGPPQVMVRGCAFGRLNEEDFSGRLFYTIASGKQSRSFLARWVESKKKSGTYTCMDNIACSDVPVTGMSLSVDGGLLVFGDTNGCITLWNTAQWKPIKRFLDVHGLPMTCAAARPYPVRYFRGEEDGVEIHARTGSGDGIMACLTLQTRAPETWISTGGGDDGVLVTIHRFIVALFLLWVFSPLYIDACNKCDLQHSPFATIGQCILEEVLIAPAWRPGVLSPPY